MIHDTYELVYFALERSKRQMQSREVAFVLLAFLAETGDHRVEPFSNEKLLGEDTINNHFGLGWRLTFNRRKMQNEAAEQMEINAFTAMINGHLASFILRNKTPLIPLPEAEDWGYTAEVKWHVKSIAMTALVFTIMMFGLYVWARYYAG